MAVAVAGGRSGGLSDGWAETAVSIGLFKAMLRVESPSGTQHTAGLVKAPSAPPRMCRSLDVGSPLWLSLAGPGLDKAVGGTREVAAGLVKAPSAPPQLPVSRGT